MPEDTTPERPAHEWIPSPVTLLSLPDTALQLVRKVRDWLPGDLPPAPAPADGEESHCYGREDLGVRSTVIPLNRRNRGRKRPKTRYRRQMVKRFRRKPRGSRHRRV